MHQSVRARHRRLRRVVAHSNRRGTALGAFALLAALAIGVAAAASLTLLSGYAGIAKTLPSDPEAIFAQQALGPAKIYDRKGTLLYEFEDESEGLRNPLPLAEISPYVINATIATEDNSFYDNPGVNVRGLARAGVENFAATDVGVLQGSGGSSITQQLAKNVFIDEKERYQRSPERKLKEAVYALELTRRYSKDQILEWYLNQIHYGNRANGIGAAARRYFGVNTKAKDLSLAQAALLAGIPQSPARYDPYRNRDAAIARQHEVLDLMVRHGQITQAEADTAKAEPLIFAENTVSLLAPHWVFYVRDQIINRFGAELFRDGGLKVITTLDLDLQNKAEQIVEDKIAFYESARGGRCECHNASVVAIDNTNGQILAMVGSRNYWRPDIEGENNNAIAIKQPGSSLKPVVYAAAFEKGWNPGTIISDQATRFLSRIEGGRKEFFTPVGPTSSYLGPLSARDSLASSMNTAAVKAAAFVGVDGVINMAHRLGITSLDDRDTYGVSIATGGANLTLLDLTYAYSTIANNGEMRGLAAVNPKPDHRRLDPSPFLQVVDGKGRVLLDYKEPQRDQVVQAGYAYQVTDVLKDPAAKRHTYTAPEIQFGLPDGRPVAAKTGTQQGPKDIKTVLATWNFGYIPQLTVGVWVGNANNALVSSNLTSASSSLLIWKEMMAAAITMLNLPKQDFPVPPDIQFENINGKKEPVVKGQKIIRRENELPWVVKPDSGMIVGDNALTGGPGPAAPAGDGVRGAAPAVAADGGAQAVPAGVAAAPSPTPLRPAFPFPIRTATPPPASSATDEQTPEPAPAPPTRRTPPQTQPRPNTAPAPQPAPEPEGSPAAPAQPVQPAAPRLAPPSQPQVQPPSQPRVQPQPPAPAPPEEPSSTTCVPGPPLYRICQR